MMRSIYAKFGAGNGTAVWILTVVGCLVMLGGCGDAGEDTALAARARDALTAGDYREAMVRYRDLAKKHPKAAKRFKVEQQLEKAQRAMQADFALRHNLSKAKDLLRRAEQLKRDQLPELAESWAREVKMLFSVPEEVSAEEVKLVLEEAESFFARLKEPVNDRESAANGDKRVGGVRYVTGSSVNVRSGAGLRYRVVSQVAVGDPVRVLAESQKWIEVELRDGTRGWIYSTLVSLKPPK